MQEIAAINGMHLFESLHSVPLSGLVPSNSDNSTLNSRSDLDHDKKSAAGSCGEIRGKTADSDLRSRRKAASHTVFPH